MLKIRLHRKGKKKKAYFSIVVTEHTVKTKGKYLELLGSYDPHTKLLQTKKERIEHWLSKGAQASPTVHNLLINNEIIKGEKVTSWKPKRKDPQPESSRPPVSGTTTT